MINSLFILAVSLFLVVKGATLATRYAGKLAEGFHLSKYTVGFIIVAIISILPETFVAINAALEGSPSFGLGVLFGGNVADLTLIFSIIIFLAGRSIKVESGILKNNKIFPFLLLLPIILGLDGNYSRLEGLALIVAGAIFYYMSLRKGIDGVLIKNEETNRFKSFYMLLFSMAILLVGSHFAVTSASSLASYLGISPILIGMFVVGLGTTMPELLFSLKSVKKNDDSLAVGDILGTVLADATIVVGILAIVSPFSFPQKIVYSTGMFMVAASIILFRFMNSGKNISKKEGYFLLFFWIIFALVEFVINS